MKTEDIIYRLPHPEGRVCLVMNRDGAIGVERDPFAKSAFSDDERWAIDRPKDYWDKHSFVVVAHYDRPQLERRIEKMQIAEAEFARRVLGDEAYDNAPCQAHPLELVENYIEELES